MKRKRIISYSIAKDLIKSGFIVIDIEPNNKDHKRTVFIFENTEALTTYLQHRREMINIEKGRGNTKNKRTESE